jgi:hypothetical protein
MRESSWKKAFPDIYEQVRLRYTENVASEASLIYLACRDKLITSDDYLAWAHCYYAIAILEDRFFNSRFERSCFDKYASLTPWSEQFYPAFEWDGVLFIACLDPHVLSQLQLEITVRPLLTSFENLQKGWQIINNITEVVSPLAPESISILQDNCLPGSTPPPRHYENPSTDFHNEQANLNSRINSNSQVEIKPVETDDRTEISQVETDDRTEISSIEEDPLIVLDESENENDLPSTSYAAEKNSDELLILDDQDSNENSLAIEEPIDLLKEDSQPNIAGLVDFDKKTTMHPSELPEGMLETQDHLEQSRNHSAKPDQNQINLQNYFAPPAPIPAPIPKSSPPPVSVGRVIPAKQSSSSLNLQNTQFTTIDTRKGPNFPPPPSATPIPPVVSTPNAEQSLVAKSMVTTIDSVLLSSIKENLSHAYKFYNRIMLLVINSNETLTPIHWDQNFKPIPTTHPIPLYQPSPFRIAFKTGKPFHGPVSMNHILELFVNDWLGNQPIHLLTIVPLIENNLPFALLLGIADNDVDPKDSLKQILTVSEETTKQIAQSATSRAG